MSILSEEILSISVSYLGPAAKVFLDRQSRAHMDGLAFTALEKKHLPEFAKWVRISSSLVIDKNKAIELSQKIEKL